VIGFKNLRQTHSHYPPFNGLGLLCNIGDLTEESPVKLFIGKNCIGQVK